MDRPDEIRKRVKLTNAEQLYQVQDENGTVLDYEEANGRQLFNHYRHRLTNYDRVLDDVRRSQGHVTGRQEKQAAVGAAERVIEKYRDEHVKVIKDGQNKGQWLNRLMRKAGVGTAAALANFLDACSDRLKELSKLENSQRTLQVWNDTYRVQRELVKKVLIEEGVSQEAIEKVNQVYKTRSVNKAVELGSDLFNLEKSEILAAVKSAIRYAKL